MQIEASRRAEVRYNRLIARCVVLVLRLIADFIPILLLFSFLQEWRTISLFDWLVIVTEERKLLRVSFLEFLDPPHSSVVVFFVDLYPDEV